MKYIARIITAQGESRKIYSNMLSEIAEAADNEEVNIVQLWTNHRFTVPYSSIGAVADVERDINWGVEAIQVDAFWNNGFKGENIRVGIADTGIDKEHNVFERALIKDFAEFDLADGEITGANAYDGGWHGTFCSSLIVGEESDRVPRGVAPNVELYVAKVLESWEGSILSVAK